MTQKSKIVPDTLYKYLRIDNNFYNSILRNYIWFSDPKTFNDPYDLNISFDFNCNENLLRKYFNSIISDPVRRKELNINDTIIEEKISEFNRNPTEFINNARENIKNIISEDYGVCCFSKNCDNLLMWSHYTDKHQGICLAYNRKIDEECFSVPYIVDYPEKYPKVNFFECRISNNFFLSQFLLATKSLDWQYEEEIRIIRDIGKYKNIRGEINFNKNCLTEVIFGYKIDIKKVHEIIELFTLLKFNVEFFKMDLKEYEFGLKKEKITLANIK
ncbi:MAG: DUF2971 domain-containing protein [Candidatus Thorarchaeota archaeon]